MAKNKQHKHDEGTELLENPEAIQESLSSAEKFLRNNSTLVFGAAAALVLIVAGIVGYNYYTGNQNDKAQEEMFQAQYWFENDSLSLALEGTTVNSGFLDIIDDYSGTDAANLANYYAGAIYLKQGEYDKAIDHLEAYSNDDLLSPAFSKSLLGDAYLEKGNYSEAAALFEAAANSDDNVMSPDYLMQAAMAYEMAGNTSKAAEIYSAIVADYPKYKKITEARKHKARLDAMASN
ncbi:tetratricopeptide repeat protein [Marinigracilibium pacificum]|uniref:Tetratricopeptide repeat protein n=1 Tax=Marinigracilibium pacificum TaxID=2729599 RepID=A0A848IUB1_9BACT|nr:tetratricopeptide repeat protein [Marinigracilibium pacificum]NMM46885.1 tetratricopeptide repeat protein [Marinigracilibium pacificum]